MSNNSRCLMPDDPHYSYHTTHYFLLQRGDIGPPRYDQRPRTFYERLKSRKWNTKAIVGNSGYNMVQLLPDKWIGVFLTTSHGMS